MLKHYLVGAILSCFPSYSLPLCSVVQFSSAVLPHCPMVVTKASREKRSNKQKGENSLKGLCHKNNGCGTIDFYVLHQGAVQANQQKTTVVLCPAHTVWTDIVEELALSYTKSLFACSIASILVPELVDKLGFNAILRWRQVKLPAIIFQSQKRL